MIVWRLAACRISRSFVLSRTAGTKNNIVRNIFEELKNLLMMETKQQ
jgi:hypothetical protein